MTSLKKTLLTAGVTLLFSPVLLAVDCATWDEASAAFAAGNDVRLTADIDIDASQADVGIVFEGSERLTFDLNGHTLLVRNGRLFTLNDKASAAELTITDSAGGGAIDGCGAARTTSLGGCVYVGRTCTLTMNGGVIRNFAVSVYRGGAVHVKDTATFRLNGGMITNCTSVGLAGAVSVDGTFAMNGGTIAGCSAFQNGSNAGRGGGVWVNQNATFQMSGGMITNCTSVGTAGAVYVDGTLTMNGGTIVDCRASASSSDNGHGGAINVSNGTFTMYGGAIRNCTAPFAGAIQCGGYSSGTGTGTVNIFGGTFSGNAAQEWGNVFNIDRGTVTIFGGHFINGSGTLERTLRNYSGTFHLYGGTFNFQPSVGAVNISSWGGSGERQLGENWIVGKNITTESGSTRLTGGTFAFDPTEACYADAGIALADGCSVELAGSGTARTATITDKPVTGTRLVNYQGYLADPATGTAYADGVYTLDLRLWKSASGTAPTDCLWGAQYSVYVKDGFFNVLLGSPNARGLSGEGGPVPFYSQSQLVWALTTDDATELYLGVTPHQDATGAALATRNEIVPRQKVTSVPFVDRALSVKYADESTGDFAVKGKMTVAGTATFKGAVNAPSTERQRFGPIQTSGTEVLISGSKTASASLPDVYDVGVNLNFRSYGDMLFKSTAGDITMTVRSGELAKITGAGSFVSTLPTTVIGGKNGDKCKTTLTGGTVYLQAGDAKIRYKQANAASAIYGGSKFNVSVPAQVTTTGELTLKGKEATLMSQNSIGGQFKINGDTVSGRGNLKWTSDGKEYAPVVFLTMSVTIPANTEESYTAILGNDQTTQAKYTWRVVGCKVAVYTTYDQLPPRCCVVDSYSGKSGQPCLYVHKNVSSVQQTVEVKIMGVLKEWSAKF